MALDGVFGMREMENAVAKIVENGIDTTKNKRATNPHSPGYGKSSVT